MPPAPHAALRPRTRFVRARVPALALAAAAVLTLAIANQGSGGGGPAPEVDIALSVAGPGALSTNDLTSIRDTDFVWSTSRRSVTFTVTPDGNGAAFAGWQGACAHEGTGDTCTIQTNCALGSIAACSLEHPGIAAAPERCMWVGATFRNDRGEAPTIVNTCAKEAPGGGGGGGEGGGTGPGGESGSGAGGAQATPRPGTVLAGGVTTVRKAPPLRRTRVSVAGRRLATTGAAPRGTTRVVQSLTLIGNAGVGVAGRCRLTRASGAFTCTASAPRGRWNVITQARRGSAVIAQTTRTVRVR